MTSKATNKMGNTFICVLDTKWILFFPEYVKNNICFVLKMSQAMFCVVYLLLSCWILIPGRVQDYCCYYLHSTDKERDPERLGNWPQATQSASK